MNWNNKQKSEQMIIKQTLKQNIKYYKFNDFLFKEIH
jgi:hypothetical protein